MLGKISVVVAVIAAIIHKNNGHSVYFWLSIANGLIILIFGYLSSYNVAKPVIEKHEKTVWEMEEDGATNEEIEEFIDSWSDEDHSDLDNKHGPIWMLIIITLAIIGSFVLLGIGIRNHF